MKKVFLLLLVLTLALTAGCAATATPPPANSPAGTTAQQALSASSPSPAASAPPATADTSASASAGAVQKIDAAGVKKMMDSGTAMTIVDVRTKGEYNGGHLKGAISIPVETIGTKKPAQLQDTGATIVVYCETGVRSALAAQELAALGYTKVYDMGGIDRWTYGTVTAQTPSPEISPSSAASPSLTPAASPSPKPSQTSAPSPSPSPKPASGGLLSAFTATDLNGHVVTADVWEGHKLTMVNIWATFCGPCIQEMPELGKLSAAYKDKGVQIVGIVADSSDNSGKPIQDAVDLAKEIVAKTGADYMHILASADLNKLLLNNVSVVPTTIFVDENGKQIGKAYVASRSGDEWAKIIDGILKGM